MILLSFFPRFVACALPLAVKPTCQSGVVWYTLVSTLPSDSPWLQSTTYGQNFLWACICTYRQMMIRLAQGGWGNEGAPAKRRYAAVRAADATALQTIPPTTKEVSKDFVPLPWDCEKVEPMLKTCSAKPEFRRRLFVPFTSASRSNKRCSAGRQASSWQNAKCAFVMVN